jgi:hypothetical protein
MNAVASRFGDSYITGVGCGTSNAWVSKGTRTMFEQWTRRPWFMLGLGVTLGVLVCAAAFTGLVAGGYAASLRGFQFPKPVLHASATESTDSMAIATGLIDEGVEGLFVLDFVTGNLQVAVINPRTGQLGGLYHHNVAADLGAQQGKAPKYLLVTGQAMFRSFTGNIRPAQSIVYIADSTSGRYAAYMLPWDRQAASYNFAQVNPLVLLGKGMARNVPVE